jgi:hypothetical protein
MPPILPALAEKRRDTSIGALQALEALSDTSSTTGACLGEGWLPIPLWLSSRAYVRAREVPIGKAPPGD